jgi:hypothetical protein
LACAGGIRLWRRGEKSLVLLLVTPLLLVLVASYLHAYPYAGSRVVVFAAPGLFVMIAEGIPPVFAWLGSWQSLHFKPLPISARAQGADLANRRTGWPHSRFATLALTILLLLPLARALQRVVFPWKRADCSGAADYVLARRRPDEKIASNHPEFAYYFRHLGSDFTLLDFPPRMADDRVWLVATAGTWEDRLQLLRQLSPGPWSTLERKEFTGTSVFLLSREKEQRVAAK